MLARLGILFYETTSPSFNNIGCIFASPGVHELLSIITHFLFACKRNLIHDTKHTKHTFNMMNQGHNVLNK